MPKTMQESLPRYRLMAYVAVVALLVIGLVDWLAVVMPLSPGDLMWRYGASGVTANSLLVPIVAFWIGFQTAFSAKDRRAVLTLALAACLLGLALWGLLGLFALDFLSIRALAAEGGQAELMGNSVQAMIKLTVSGVFFSTCAVVGVRFLTRTAMSSRRASAGPGVVSVSRPN